MFEATECTWDKLLEEVQNCKMKKGTTEKMYNVNVYYISFQVCRATDLDQVIKAHSVFLDNITKRSLLDEGKRELLNQLRGIFETVYKFQAFLTKFDARVGIELNERKKKKMGTYTKEESLELQKGFFTDYVSLAKGEIEALYDTTQVKIKVWDSHVKNQMFEFNSL